MPYTLPIRCYFVRWFRVYELWSQCRGRIGAWYEVDSVHIGRLTARIWYWRYPRFGSHSFGIFLLFRDGQTCNITKAKKTTANPYLCPLSTTSLLFWIVFKTSLFCLKLLRNLVLAIFYSFFLCPLLFISCWLYFKLCIARLKTLMIILGYSMDGWRHHGRCVRPMNRPLHLLHSFGGQTEKDLRNWTS